jgi:hypothetical protein
MQRLSGSIAVLMLAVTAVSPTDLSAQAPFGAEFRVNTYTTGAQRWPAIASDAGGTIVVAWQSDGQDGDLDGIYAKRFRPSGAVIGSAFRTHTHTLLRQMSPAVASSPTGDFIVVWQSDGQDGDQFGIYARRFNALGAALEGTEFRVNETTTGSQSFPDVGMDPNGNFMVVWESTQNGGLDIFARRYTASGLSGPEFLVNSHTTGAQGLPAVAVDSDSESVIVWRSFAQDGSLFGLYGQRYSPTGVAQGVFPVNTVTTGNQDNPAVTYRDDGSFVVVWESDGLDGSGEGVFRRHFSPSGVAQGAELQVNTFTTGGQELADVASYQDGRFVVVWRGPGESDSSGSFGQRFDAAGLPEGAEFRINTHTTDTQGFSVVASAPSGVFVVAWQSRDQDGSDYGIYAQRFGDLIFEDGFE